MTAGRSDALRLGGLSETSVQVGYDYTQTLYQLSHIEPRNVRPRAQRTVDTVGGRRNSLYPALGQSSGGKHLYLQYNIIQNL